MKLILGGIDGHYLTDLLFEAEALVDGRRRVESVWAAVAYVSDIRDQMMLLRWSLDKDIPLHLWGRLDDRVAVSIEVLNTFLSARSPDFVCKLVPKHHAKVIWWRGFGIYIGSGNLTYPAWFSNVEAGCFFTEDELSAEQIGSIENLFSTLDEHSSPLTEELRDHLVIRAKRLKSVEIGDEGFWKHPSVTNWTGLVKTQRKAAAARQRESFLAEWNSTLQSLRDIAALVSRPENRPPWIEEGASPGAQADQFLHAHYYLRTFDGQRADYERHFRENQNRTAAALAEAVAWWRELPGAPSDRNPEDQTINVIAPLLRDLLSPERLMNLAEAEFRELAEHIHAMIEYARRVPNGSVGLPSNRRYSIPEKLDALCAMLWRQRSPAGHSVLGVLHHILYGGPENLLPERLWETLSDPSWKISNLGISTLGETVGWAMPDRFPPRNGRTSKALRSLGMNVKVHAG